MAYSSSHFAIYQNQESHFKLWTFYVLFKPRQRFGLIYAMIIKSIFKKHSTLCCIVPNITLSLCHNSQNKDYEY